jgi:hypothetical protein
MKTKIKLLALTLSFLMLAVGCDEIGAAFPDDLLPKVNDRIYFGSFSYVPGTPDPLQWTVLDNTNGELLLLCDEGPANRAFDASNQSFDNSDLKAWLNNEFLAEFKDAEKQALAENAGGLVSLLTQEEFNKYASDITQFSTTWWLSSDGSDPSRAVIVDTSTPPALSESDKTSVLGVRPAIRIRVDKLRLIMSQNAGQDLLINHGTMYMFNDPSNSFTLAVEYNSLPKLTITGERVINGELTVSYQSSRALDPDEKIICILDDQYGDGFYIGCSPDNGGQASFNIGSYTLGTSDYKMMLMTGVIGDAEQTTAVGMPAQYNNIISALGVEGIEKGESFYPGEQIGIEASGFDYLTYDTSGGGLPVSITGYWVPASWSVNGGPSGSWAESPYAAEFAMQNPGSYSLNVVFEDHVGSPNAQATGTMTRVINFTVAKPEDDTFTVSYHPNGASGTAPMDMNRYYRGDKAALMGADGLSMPGAYFSGWSLTPDGPVIRSPYTMGKGDVTLFAVWREGKLPEVPKTSDPASVIGFAMLAIAPAIAAAFVIGKRRAK